MLGKGPNPATGFQRKCGECIGNGECPHGEPQWAWRAVERRLGLLLLALHCSAHIPDDVEHILGERTMLREMAMPGGDSMLRYMTMPRESTILQC